MTVELISIHIAKTAGSAFRAVLAQVYGCEQLLLDYPPEEYLPPQPLPQQIRVIHGHVLARKYSGYFPTAKRITWLRHPISRLISDYFFSKVARDPNNPVHLKLLEENLSLLEFAKQKDIRNMQSYQLAGTKLEDFDFVGLQEFYEEDLRAFQQQMNWGEVSVKVSNVNPQPAYHRYLYEVLSNRQLVSELALLNAKDMTLYHQAITLRAKRRRESVALQYALLSLGQVSSLTQALERERQHWAFWAKQPQRSLQIALHPVDQRLLGFYIDSPRLDPDQSLLLQDDWLAFSGWVVGQTLRVVAVQVLYQTEIIFEMAVDGIRLDVLDHYPTVPQARQSGFVGQMPVAGIPSNTDLSLNALLEDGTTAPLAKILIRASKLDFSQTKNPGSLSDIQLQMVQ